MPQILYVGLTSGSNPTLVILIATLLEGDLDCHVTASSLYLYMRECCRIKQLVILICDY